MDQELSLTDFVTRRGGGGGEYQNKNLVVVYDTLPETLTLFQTKICDFFPTLSQTWPLNQYAWQAVTARSRLA